jgi:two-component system CheB/CheR fusion protein
MTNAPVASGANYADDTVLHVSERAAHLLRLPGGALSNKLLMLARPEIRLPLRAALARAAATGRSVEAPRILLTINGHKRFLNLSVRPAHDDTAKGLLLVVFDESEETLVADDGAKATDQHPMLVTLEAELHKAQQQLRSSAGESAASTEELRASNEELQTINEELRSTTEELETSREELQAVNEELITVNHELQLKIDETAKVNDDLQNLIVSAEVGTVFVDRGLRIKRFTPQSATLFNLRHADVGRPLLDITHRLDYPQLSDDVAEVFSSLRRIEREVRSQDGRWLLVRVLPYRTSEDHIDGAVLTFVDVSARRVAEEELRLSEQRMRLVVESMRDYAIITTDLEGLVTSWSPGAERTFGHTAEEAVGQPGEIIFTPDDRQRGAAQQEMQHARESGRAEADRWHLHKDGHRLFCSGIMSPLVDGAPIGYARICRDLTRSKLYETRREAALNEERMARGRLEEVSVMKDEFLAVMSHELKNPLNIIQMNAELLTRLPQVRDDRMLTRAARTIKSAVKSQTQIINDLLDLSRVNTGKVELEPSRLLLNEVVQQIADAISQDVVAKQQGLVLDLKQPVAVFADGVRVEQIVWNLVTNALKFTPAQGKIALTVGEDAGMARLDVHDTGIGLDAADLDDVFEMFRQVDSGTHRRKGGLGIGLALVKQLAELHSGRVGARSDGLGMGYLQCMVAARHLLALGPAGHRIDGPSRGPGHAAGR